MIQNVVGIWDSTEDKFIEANPLIYSNGAWVRTLPYVYDEDIWHEIGAAKTLMIPLIPVGDNYFFDATESLFLVRSHI